MEFIYLFTFFLLPRFSTEMVWFVWAVDQLTMILWTSYFSIRINFSSRIQKKFNHYVSERNCVRADFLNKNNLRCNSMHQHNNNNDEVVRSQKEKYLSFVIIIIPVCSFTHLLICSFHIKCNFHFVLFHFNAQKWCVCVCDVLFKINHCRNGPDDRIESTISINWTIRPLLPRHGMVWQRHGHNYK